MRRVLSTTILGLAVAMGAEVARAQPAPAKPAEPDPAKPKAPDGAAATVQLLDYDTQTIRVPAGTGEVSVLYPFKLPKNAAPAAVHVASAMRGDERSTDIGGRLTPAVLEDAPSHERTLKLALALADPIEPGTYDVKLRFELPAAAGEAQDPARTTVKIVVPAADLHAPAKQIVELIDGQGALPPLVLRELSRRSRITLQAIEPLDAFQSEGKAITPTLAVARPKGAIGSDDAPLAVSMTGAFPLGTSTGKLRISAFELEKPVDVEYEVRNKRSLPWIALPTVGGLLLSAGLRWLLETRRKKLEALHKVDEALASLEAEKQRRPDAELAKKLDRVLEELRLKRRAEKDAEGLVAAVTTAQTARNEALADFNSRKAALATRFDQLKGVLQGRGHLPPGLRAVIADQKAPLEAAAACLERDDADPKYLDKIEGDLAEGARTICGAWQSTVVAILRSSSKLDGLFAGPEAKSELINKLGASLPATSAKDRIDALDKLHVAVSEPTQRLLIQLHTVVEGLAGAAGQPPPALVTAGKELVELQRLYEAKPDEPEVVLLRTLDVMPDLLRPAVESLIPPTTLEADRKAINDLVAAGKYLEVPDKLKEARAAAQKVTGTAQGGSTAMVAPIALGASVLAAPVPAPIASMEATIAAGTAAALPWGDVRKVLESELATQVITLLGSSVVVTLVAILTHAKTFVGTDEEMLSLLSWAVGLNVIGTESILALLGARSTEK